MDQKSVALKRSLATISPVVKLPAQNRRLQPLEPGELDLAPVEVASRCRDWPGLVFFDSALPEAGALSVIAAHPVKIVAGRTDEDWERLRQAVAALQNSSENQWGIPHGFAAGWVEYDGAFCFGIYDRLLAFRHGSKQEGPGGTWYSLGDFHTGLSETPAGMEQASVAPALHFSPTLSRESFIQMVCRAQEYIAAGDIYQVNLSHRFVADWARYRLQGGTPFAFYRALRQCSPAPQAAFLALGGRQICSSSPEMFLAICGRKIRTRPIKGTRPRCCDRQADERSARELVTSAKEISELIMITDLERNDLGRVCEYGSVSVSDLLKLERYEQVFHLESTVEGRLRANVDAVTALRTCFPGGSITGAPKKRAMEIIAELEPVPRGLYTGAIGYFGFNGLSQFSIAIRTAIVEGDVAHFHAGAGIVADSVPEREWRETLEKALGILLASGQFLSKLDASLT